MEILRLTTILSDAFSQEGMRDEFQLAQCSIDKFQSRQCASEWRSRPLIISNQATATILICRMAVAGLSRTASFLVQNFLSAAHPRSHFIHMSRHMQRVHTFDRICVRRAIRAHRFIKTTTTPPPPQPNIYSNLWQVQNHTSQHPSPLTEDYSSRL